MTIRNLIAELQDVVDDMSNELTLDSDILVSLDEDGIYPAMSVGIMTRPSSQAAYIEVELG